MWCGVITLFPQMFDVITQCGITSRAVKQNLLTLKTWDPRDFTKDNYATVDDRPYGGGPGMVMMAQPIRDALAQAKATAPGDAHVIYVTPAGKRFDVKRARELALSERPLIFISGRYEGIDNRVIERDIDEQISIGDYVLSGGELAVMVVIDAITRWIPGALGHEDSAQNDAFSSENDGLLDCPHYTRPAMLNDQAVPSVLLSGDHQAIKKWRKKQSLGQTWLLRPDILENLALDETSRALLAEFQLEYES